MATTPADAALADALADIYAFLLAKRAKREAAGTDAGQAGEGLCRTVPGMTTEQKNPPAGGSRGYQEKDGRKPTPDLSRV